VASTDKLRPFPEVYRAYLGFVWRTLGTERGARMRCTGSIRGSWSSCLLKEEPDVEVSPAAALL
jgi:hypothetical protein